MQNAYTFPKETLTGLDRISNVYFDAYFDIKTYVQEVITSLT